MMPTIMKSKPRLTSGFCRMMSSSGLSSLSLIVVHSGESYVHGFVAFCRQTEVGILDCVGPVSTCDTDCPLPAADSIFGEELPTPIAHVESLPHRWAHVSAQQVRFRHELADVESVVVDDFCVVMRDVLDDERRFTGHLGCVKVQALPGHQHVGRLTTDVLVRLEGQAASLDVDRLDAHAGAADVLYPEHSALLGCFSVFAGPFRDVRHVGVGIHDSASADPPCDDRSRDGQACADGGCKIKCIPPIHDSSFLRHVGWVVGIAFPSLTRRRKVPFVASGSVGGGR